MTHQDTEVREITRALEVALQPAEMAQVAKEAGAVDAELKSEQEKFKAVKKEWKARLDGIEARRDQLLEQANTGTKTEQVKCSMEMNYSANTVTIKTPEGYVVEERPMTHAERQSNMPFADERPEPEEEEESPEPGSDEQRQDIADTIRAEQSKNKPSLTG